MTNTWVISDCTAIKCSIPESNVIGGQGFPWLIRRGLILFLGVCSCEKMRKNHYFYSSLFAYQKKKKKVPSHTGSEWKQGDFCKTPGKIRRAT